MATEFLTSCRTLAMSVHDLVCRVFLHGQSGSRLVQVSLTMPVLSEEVSESAAMQAVKAQRAQLERMLPEVTDAAPLLPWLIAQPQVKLLDLLAFCIGSAVDTIESRDQPHACFAQLANALGLDMRAWWRPTSENYWNHVQTSRTIEVVGRVLSPEGVQPLLAMKKDAVAARAEQLLVGTGWLPTPLL